MSPPSAAKAAERDRLLDAAAAHYAADRLAEAARAYEAAEALDRDDVRAPYSLAVIDISTGRLPSAATRLKRVLKQKPDLFPALFNLGSVSQSLGRWSEAADAYGRALALRPDAADIRMALAVALAIVGRIDEAVGHYRSLAGDPRLGLNALARLAMIRPTEVTDTELERMRAAADEAATAPPSRIALQFALGETLEARGAYDAAFAAFEAGNRQQRAALAAAGPASDPDVAAADHLRSIERIEALFTPAFLAAQRGRGDESTAPIFIVGMPRTGSTLIEQILASHPQAMGLGEAGPLGAALERRGAYRPETAKDAGLFRGVADEVAAAWRAAGWTKRLRPVDKTLENYLHVGMIQLIFPRAVVLNCVRDPIDTGLACYRQLFEVGNETLYDLTDIGQAYRNYRRMMDHWAAVLPGRVIDVSLEALVADPRTQIRWLVTEACGLAWDDACLAFHETERPVKTASAAQVRQPIFASSLQRWRRYEAHLGPLIEALGPYADATGTHHSIQAPG